MYSVSHTVWEDNVLQILSCSKFRKHQIELEIKKMNRNTKIHKIEKNIVEKKTNMENATRIIFCYIIYHSTFKLRNEDIDSVSPLFGCLTVNFGLFSTGQPH